MTKPDATPDAPQPPLAPPPQALAPPSSAVYADPPYAPGQVGPPPAGQPVYYYMGPDPRTAKNWMNIVALVASLAGFLNGITVIPGIVFGHLGRAAERRGEANNGGFGLAGLIVGYVLLALGAVVTIGYLIFIGAVFAPCLGPDPDPWCTEAFTSIVSP